VDAELRFANSDLLSTSVTTTHKLARDPRRPRSKLTGSRGYPEAQRFFLARVKAALRADARRLRVTAPLRAAARRFRVTAAFWAGDSLGFGLAFMGSLPLPIKRDPKTTVL